MNEINVGLIGLGVRGLDSLARPMARLYPETAFRITALCDRNPQRMVEAREWIQGHYAEHGITIDPTLYEDGLDVISDPNVDFIVITSITDTHRHFAVPALHSGKKVYCDKPLAQNVADAVAIVDAETASQNPLIMGFTRRYETPWLKAFSLLQEGVIGDLKMMQIRDIIPYHRYLTAWWRRREWSGGALNDKGCHLFDVFNWFTGSRATRIHGYGDRSVIEPEADPPERCSQCQRECVYRRRDYQTKAPIHNDMVMHFGDSWLHETDEKYMDDVCVYRQGSDLYHNSSIHLTYENGVIANFFFSIFGPPAQDEETLELVGTKGRLILTRHTGQIDLVTDHGQTRRTIDSRDEHFADSHFGADLALVRELRRFCDGAPPTVSARAGLEATRLVMAALDSMDRGGEPIHMNEVLDAVL